MALPKPTGRCCRVIFIFFITSLAQVRRVKSGWWGGKLTSQKKTPLSLHLPQETMYTARPPPPGQRSLLIFNIDFLSKKKCVKKRKNPQIWVHPINLRRREQGAYHNLVRQLYDDEERLVQYFRLNRELHASFSISVAISFQAL